jgi:plasmid stabilization system protein ParE
MPLVLSERATRDVRRILEWIADDAGLRMAAALPKEGTTTFATDAGAREFDQDLRNLGEASAAAVRIFRSGLTAVSVQPDPRPPVDPPDPGSWDELLPQRTEPVKPTSAHAQVYPDRYEFGGNTAHTSNPIVDAFGAVDGAMGPESEEPVVLALHGPCGRVGLGTASSLNSSWLLRPSRPGIRLALIGASEDAVAGPFGFGRDPDDGPWPHVDYFGQFDCGIKGNPDSFAIRSRGEIRGTCEFDNWWIVPDKPERKYTSMLHLKDGWDELTLKRYQARGLLTKEHIPYLKHGGRTQILDCELQGGNRTGGMTRPHKLYFSSSTSSASPPPTGDYIVDGCHATNFGSEHDGADGGQWITVYASAALGVRPRCRVTNNRLEGCRYGGIGVLWGGSEKSYTIERGVNHCHAEVFVGGNTMRDCARKAAHIEATEHVHIGPGNDLDNLVFNDDDESAAIKSIKIYGEESIPSCPTSIFEDGVERAMTPDELKALVV